MTCWAVSPLPWGGAIRFAAAGSDPLPSGCRLWAAAAAVAGLLSRLPTEALHGCRVLELSAGCGLPGIRALSLGCRELVSSDADASAFAALRGNLRRLPPHLACAATAQQLDFRDPYAVGQVAAAPPGGGFRLVLASEYAYEVGSVAAVVSALGALLAPCGLGVLANRVRPVGMADMRDQLKAAADAAELEVHVLMDADARPLLDAGLAECGLDGAAVSGCWDSASFLALVGRRGSSALQRAVAELELGVANGQVGVAAGAHEEVISFDTMD